MSKEIYYSDNDRADLAKGKIEIYPGEELKCPKCGEYVNLGDQSLEEFGHYLDLRRVRDVHCVFCGWKGLEIEKLNP